MVKEKYEKPVVDLEYFYENALMASGPDTQLDNDNDGFDKDLSW